ncbi:hypothetical protein LCGC14_2114300 [marine sediment metagenome]|uniref:Uncharacterized protein n=1 Tax=marine sediment metagenome TaxID=412755 RepID=A0A0F9E693_9ZZZZ
MKKQEKCISVKSLLKDAREAFEMVIQWGVVKDSYEWNQTVTRYLIEANSIIELVEVFDCGSVGGFGAGQMVEDYHTSLFDRWTWLCQKYHPKYKISRELIEYFERK